MSTTTPAPQAPEINQLPFSFMSLVQKAAKLPKSSRSRTIDPLTAAKQKILAALEQQDGFVSDLADGKPLPKAKGGEKTVSTWFSKQNDGWWTCIRYGQVSLPLGPNGETDLLIGDLPALMGFYGAVKIAIANGELDGPIGKLQADKSAALQNSKKGR